MSAHAPVPHDERTALAAFIAQQQEALRAAAHGLADAEAGSAAAASALSVGTLIKHLASVQRSWLDRALAAPAAPHDDRPMPERIAEHVDAFTWHDTDTLAGVLATYDEVCEAVLAAVDRLDLETPVPVPDMPWFPKDITHWSMRWVWFHLLEEVARHAGHADIVRESVDGATAVELLAAREGWPEDGFVTPWKPAAPA
jgi:uncharacterized damage-inducible protein DinB